MNVTLSQASTLIRTVGQTNTVLLRGQPGIGKSSILHNIREFFPNHFMSYIDAANLDLGDIAMPVVDREELITEYAPNARFGVGRNQRKPVVMMIDELGKASRPVMNMLLPVILERRIGDLQLPAGSIIFATTNLDTDGVGDNIPAHAYNRMSVVTVANPTSDEWLQWASNNNVCPEVMAFAKQTPEIFDCYVDLEKNAKNPYIFNPMAGVVRGFCSPRSLAKASNIIAQRAVLGSAVLPALAGTIGEPAARQMEALINLADQLPLFEQIVKAPATTKIPKGAGALFLLAFMLAGRVNEDSMDAVMEYSDRISKESFEAHSLIIMTLASNKTKVNMACKNRAFTTAASKLGKFF
jgi:AAA domain (dynein-related subfamily)